MVLLYVRPSFFPAKTTDGGQVRADEEDKHEAAQGKKAEEQAVRWFTRWFASPPP